MTEHTLISENRETLEVTAVTDVSSFDENAVLILLEEGALSVRGRSLRITQLDLDTGKAALTFAHLSDLHCSCARFSSWLYAAPASLFSLKYMRVSYRTEEAAEEDG